MIRNQHAMSEQIRHRARYRRQSRARETERRGEAEPAALRGVSLATVISPCIRSTNRLTMASPPPPDPVGWLVGEFSRAKAAQIASNRSRAIPPPVSLTLKESWVRATEVEVRGVASTSTTIPPTSVNLTALATRLTMICRSRSGSPIRYSGTPGATRVTKSRCLRCARTAKVDIVRSIKSVRSNWAFSSCRRPLSIRARSRIEFTRSTRVAPFWPARMSRYWRCFGANLGVGEQIDHPGHRVHWGTDLIRDQWTENS